MTDTDARALARTLLSRAGPDNALAILQEIAAVTPELLPATCPSSPTQTTTNIPPVTSSPMENDRSATEAGKTAADIHFASHHQCTSRIVTECVLCGSSNAPSTIPSLATLPSVLGDVIMLAFFRRMLEGRSRITSDETQAFFASAVDVILECRSKINTVDDEAAQSTSPPSTASSLDVSLDRLVHAIPQLHVTSPLLPSAAPPCAPAVSASNVTATAVPTDDDPDDERWYWVTKGKNVGVFRGWHATSPLVTGVSGNTHSKATSRAAVQRIFDAALARGDVQIIE